MRRGSLPEAPKQEQEAGRGCGQGTGTRGTLLVHTDSPGLLGPAQLPSGCLHLITMPWGLTCLAALTPEPGSWRGPQMLASCPPRYVQSFRLIWSLIERIPWVCSKPPVQPGSVSSHHLPGPGSWPCGTLHRAGPRRLCGHLTTPLTKQGSPSPLAVDLMTPSPSLFSQLPCGTWQVSSHTSLW